ncbi:hypothetical protein IFM89_037689, partial [Coptis chinensis]
MEDKLNATDHTTTLWENLLEAEMELLQHHDLILRQQHLHWGQKVGYDWDHKGDLDTIFFHATVSRRRHRSNIKHIHDGNGNILTSWEDIGEHLQGYFSDLLASKEPNDPSNFLEAIPLNMISNDDNLSLLKPVTHDEIFLTLKTVGSLKSLGLDGFNALFYNHFWDIVGPKVSTLCLVFAFLFISLKILTDLEIQNISLLGKKAWELLSPTSMWAKCMKEKYFPKTDFMRVKCPRSASKIWKDIVKLKPFLDMGIRWHVGDGLAIWAWIDSWVPDTPSPLHLRVQPSNCILNRVNDFIDPATRTWKVANVMSFWPSEYVARILSIPLSVDPHPDYRLWAHDKYGHYSVRSTYLKVHQ